MVATATTITLAAAAFATATATTNATTFAIVTTVRCHHYRWPQPNMSKDNRDEVNQKLEVVEDSPQNFNFMPIVSSSQILETQD